MTIERVIPLGFYVYTHARPDGSVFYVGKGKGRRAWDFSPRRRTKHHRNIAMKHGIRQIIVHLWPCESEDAAFELERKMIADRASTLINLTTGGEGASGRPISPKVRAAFAKARGPGHYESLPDHSKQNILDGLARGREKAAVWRQTPEAKTFIRTLGRRSALALLNRAPEQRTCGHCDGEFLTKSPKAITCSKLCQQRLRRAREKMALGINA